MPLCHPEQTRKVINFSFGSNSAISANMMTALDAADNANVMLVAAAGNAVLVDACNIWPASYDKGTLAMLIGRCLGCSWTVRPKQRRPGRPAAASVTVLLTLPVRRLCRCLHSWGSPFGGCQRLQ